MIRILYVILISNCWVVTGCSQDSSPVAVEREAAGVAIQPGFDNPEALLLAYHENLEKQNSRTTWQLDNVLNDWRFLSAEGQLDRIGLLANRSVEGLHLISSDPEAAAFFEKHPRLRLAIEDGRIRASGADRRWTEAWHSHCREASECIPDGPAFQKDLDFLQEKLETARHPAGARLNPNAAAAETAAALTDLTKAYQSAQIRQEPIEASSQALSVMGKNAPSLMRTMIISRDGKILGDLQEIDGRWYLAGPREIEIRKVLWDAIGAFFSGSTPSDVTDVPAYQKEKVEAINLLLELGHASRPALSVLGYYVLTGEFALPLPPSSGPPTLGSEVVYTEKELETIRQYHDAIVTIQALAAGAFAKLGRFDYETSFHALSRGLKHEEMLVRTAASVAVLELLDQLKTEMETDEGAERKRLDQLYSKWLLKLQQVLDEREAFAGAPSAGNRPPPVTDLPNLLIHSKELQGKWLVAEMILQNKASLKIKQNNGTWRDLLAVAEISDDSILVDFSATKQLPDLDVRTPSAAWLINQFAYPSETLPEALPEVLHYTVSESKHMSRKDLAQVGTLDIAAANFGGFLTQRGWFFYEPRKSEDGLDILVIALGEPLGVRPDLPLLLSTPESPEDVQFRYEGGDTELLFILTRGPSAEKVVETISLAGAAQEVPAVQERLRLEGKWKCMGAEQNGRQQADFLGSVMTIRDGVMTRTLRDPIDPSLAIEMQVQIDPEQEPAHFDIVALGETVHGIYKLEGDRLTTCTGKVGGARPTAFDSTARGGVQLMVWESQK